MAWRIEVDKDVQRSMRKLDKQIANRIVAKLHVQQLLGASEVVAHVPFAAAIPTRIAVAIGDGLPSRVDDRDEPQDTPPISRVFDVTVLQVGLADGVDGAAPTA